MKPSTPKKKMKISVFELVSYIISGILGLWGLVETVVGAVALNLGPNVPLKIFDDLYKKTFGLNMLYWGIILMSIGAVIAVIVLVACAKSADREYEKSQRRAARLAKDTKPAEEVVEAKVEEAK